MTFAENAIRRCTHCFKRSIGRPDMPKNKAKVDLVELPEVQNTVPEVFIFESLKLADEQARRFEGQVLADMLKLSGMNPKYYYSQSVDELPHLLRLFRQSKYRYLHISAHATDTHVQYGHELLTYQEFADIFAGHLPLRRLFFSACQVGNRAFVDAIKAKNKGMHSVVAPAESIRVDHAAALWSSFYISMFTANQGAMKRADIRRRLQALTTLFPVDFFFASYNANLDNWTFETVKKT